MEEVELRKCAFYQIGVISQTDDELVYTTRGVNVHGVPENRLPANRCLGLRPDFRFFG